MLILLFRSSSNETIYVSSRNDVILRLIFIRDIFYFQGVTETPSANSEGSTSSRSSGKYTPLGALADLQPGSHNKSSRKTHHQNNPPVTGLVQPQVHSEPGSRESRQTTHESQQAHSSNTSSRFSSTIQHQGKL